MNQPLAYIHPNARIADDVKIEPFAWIGEDVEIGSGTWVGPNATIMDGARIGKNCKIFPGAVICRCARGKGEPLYKYLKEPLVRRFGSEWYEELLEQIKLRETNG